MTADVRDLRLARVLVELGELDEAEPIVTRALEAAPGDLDLLSLRTKLAHMRGDLAGTVAGFTELHARSPILTVDDPRPALEAARAELERGEPRALEIEKLEGLVAAWTAEQSGALDDACEILVRLGGVPGLETDTDRVLALARLYERSGAPHQLEAAVHILGWLHARYGTLSLLGRLARLHARLGHTRQAERYAAEHLAAFRARNHRVGSAEISAAAAEHHIALRVLRRRPFVAREIPADASPRVRALAAALSGELLAARARFADLGEPIDRAYLADLEDLAVLRDRAPSEPGRVGRALAASTLRFAGKGKGLVHEVLVSRSAPLDAEAPPRTMARLPGGSAPELGRALAATLEGARGYALSRWPEATAGAASWDYTVSLPWTEQAGGGAVELPAALALVSAMMGRPVPGDIAAAGALAEEGRELHVRGIEDAERRVKGAHHRNLRLVVLPRANEAELERSAEIPAAVRRELVRYAATLAEAVRLVFGSAAPC